MVGLLPRRRPGIDRGIDVAFVVPRSGPAGIFGPSCEACGTLAVEELNAAGGLLGRELRLRVVDGGAPPPVVAAQIARMLAAGQVSAVSGWHISAVRQELAPLVSGRVPYVYPTLYEGGEHTPGVFLAGETPDRQVLPALGWMARELGVRSWCVVGDDYVWPRVSARVTRRFARRSGIAIVDEMFVPLGTDEFAHVMARIERSGADGVLMFLVGSDAVRFNRAFAAAGLDARCLRLSPLMEENMLLASGVAGTGGLYASAGWFESLPTASGLDFSRRYVARFGVDAPALNSMGESCYEGLTLLAKLVTKAGSLDADALAAASGSLSYEGPRGAVRMAGNHLLQSVHLAKAEGLEFDVVAQLCAAP